MKKAHRLLLLPALAALALAGCYDDDKAWEAIGNQQVRIEALEAWQKTTTSNIEALSALSGDKECITGMNPIIRGGKTVGYTITFTSHDPVSIYHGTEGPQGPQGNPGGQGEPGATPLIGITRGEDGNRYWTLNGDILTGPDGQPMRANPTDGTDGAPGTPGTPGAPGSDGTPGTPGADGNDAPLPRVPTGQQLADSGANPATDGTGTDGAPLTQWNPTAVYLSVDGGKKWTCVSGPDGKDGVPIFSGVDTTTDPNTVTFTLADGTSFTVPRAATAALPALTFAYASGQSPKRVNAIPADPAEPYLLCESGNRLTLYYDIAAPDGSAPNVNVSAYVTDGSAWWFRGIERKERAIAVECPGGVTAPRGTLCIAVTDNKGHERTYLFNLKLLFDGVTGQNPDRPMTISCAAELKKLAEQVYADGVNGDAFANQYFRLENDIDLKGEPWMPIGRAIIDGNTQTWAPFSGHFDGGGHCIRGLKVDVPNECAGLFGYMKGGSIKNLTLVSPEVKTVGGMVYCGALAGAIQGATLANCYVQGGNCTGERQVGGLVGSASLTSITDCHVKGTAVKTAPNRSQAGGLAGYVDASDKEMIKRCSATDCSVTTFNIGGGLIGQYNASHTTADQVFIEACYASGTLDVGPNQIQGALIASCFNASWHNIRINGCYSAATAGTPLKLVGDTGGVGNAIFHFAGCYLIGPAKPEGDLPTGITWRTEAPDGAMADAMNGALTKSNDMPTPYRPDGTLKSEPVWPLK